MKEEEEKIYIEKRVDKRKGEGDIQDGRKQEKRKVIIAMCGSRSSYSLLQKSFEA